MTDTGRLATIESLCGRRASLSSSPSSLAAAVRFRRRSSGQRSCATLLAADTFRAISATTVPRGLEHTEDAELDLLGAAALN
jgi:hypothetical protein